MRQIFDVNDYSFDVDKLGKIIVYLRKSREDMIDGRYASDEETLSRHEEQLQAWAKNTLGYEIPPENIYKEVGSGEKIKSRPVFKEVLTMIEQGDVDGVLVLNCSRLSRGDLVDCGNIIKTFEITKTLVLTPQKIYNLQNKHDKRYFKDELLRGNDYLEQAKELLANGRHWSTSQGKFVGSVAPYGYDKVTCKEMDVADKRGYTLRPNDNAQYVKMIFDMFIEGIGVYRIASHLKEIKAPAPSIKGWEHCTVNNVLSSVTYGGYLTWGKRTKQEKIVNHEVVEFRAVNDNYPIYKGLHTAIVPYEVIQEVQERLKRQAPANPLRKDLDTKNPFASLLKCAICGRAIVRQVHGQVKRKRKYPLDKAELQTFIKYHKKALKLSNAEIARRIGIKLHHANEWFGNNPKKFYPSDLFVEKWEQLKSLLQITDNRFDKAVTVFEDVKKPDTLSCSGHRCKNVSANLVTVENKVHEKVTEKISNYKDFLDNYAEEYTKRIDTVKTAQQNIDKQIAMIEKQLKNAKIAFEQEAYTLQEFIDRKKELNSDLEKLQEQKQQDEAITEEEKTITIKKAVPKLEKVFASYPDFSPSEKNDLLKTVIESIMYLKEEQKTDNIYIDICWLI